MAELISEKLRWFLNSAPGYWGAMEKINSKIIYMNERMLPIYGFASPADAEGRDMEETRSPMAEYTPIFRQQNNEVMANRTPKEYFDTHFCADKKWYCFHGTKRPFYSDEDNESLEYYPYSADAIAGVIYQGIDITAPATIELARYLATYNNSASGQVSYEIGATAQAVALSETQQRLLFWQLRDTPNQQIAQRLGCSQHQLEAQWQALWQQLGVSNHHDCISKAIALGYQQVLPKSIFLEYWDV